MAVIRGLAAKAAGLPDLPGVYLFKDEQGTVIYCGKATSLRKRVMSYLRPAPDPNPRRELLASHIRDLEYIVTGSELEALILESNLIKRHRPRFNVVLKDDKHYPHLCVTMNEPFPRLTVVRRIKRDGGRYFGPYTPAHALRQTLRVIHRIFPVRRCQGPMPKNPGRPCLNHQIGLCCAPCAGLITRERYRELMQEVILFLQGKRDDLIRMLRRDMEEAAHAQRYEQAATLRDQIRAVETCLEKQHVYSTTCEDYDCFSFAREGNRACAQVFFIRFGRMTGRKSLHIAGVQDIPEGELMAGILEQFYQSGKSIPPTVLVQAMPSDRDLLEQWLSRKRGTKVTIQAPRRGDKKRLLLMAQTNAALELEVPVEDGRMQGEDLLRQVQEDLHLPRPPRRIEGFDISNLGPTEAVGSMVCWRDGEPDKSAYRRFRIKGVEGIDDYGMMAEVLKRRYERLGREQVPMPDLVLIDGGKGHLQAGLRVFRELGLPDQPVISLAKREELIYSPDRTDPLAFPDRSPTLQLLQRIRDEAHRFAITYQKTRRKRRAFSSGLDEIPGVGPRRKQMILRHFSGLEAIRKATEEDLAAVPGIDRNTARRVFEHFHEGR
ncbi:MAG: excinuclease ABC subunit UvrC [bacterium]